MIESQSKGKGWLRTIFYAEYAKYYHQYVHVGIRIYKGHASIVQVCSLEVSRYFLARRP